MLKWIIIIISIDLLATVLFVCVSLPYTRLTNCDGEQERIQQLLKDLKSKGKK